LHSFTASRFSLDGKMVHPDRLFIDAEKVTYLSNRAIGDRQIVVSQKNIASVQIKNYLLFADVIIETYGGQFIEAKGFTKSDAQKIKEFLT